MFKFAIITTFISIASLSFAKDHWTKIQIGVFSGKPGYFAKVGTEFQLQLDAVLMNEGVMHDIEKAFTNANLGAIKTCEAKGAQQSIGFTIFKVRNCQ